MTVLHYVCLVDSQCFMGIFMPSLRSDSIVPLAAFCDEGHCNMLCLMSACASHADGILKSCRLLADACALFDVAVIERHRHLIIGNALPVVIRTAVFCVIGWCRLCRIRMDDNLAAVRLRHEILHGII